MGKMEEESRRRAKKGELQRIILQSAKATGYIAAALLVPNVVGALHKLGIIQSPRHSDVIRRASDVLVMKGAMEWKEGKLRLTTRGEKELRALTLAEFGNARPRRWDGKWRVLVFDIPEKRKGLRQKVRNTLITIGFERLQDSVWVYPYDCEDLIMLLKADFHVGDDMLYMIVDSIERDKDLRDHFQLK
jgi:DNA-binding transcriptional regulator PaaX